MQLSQGEIRDITRYLEEGKPLPEKYRFYLFEDKKEVELVWNGKSNETTNVVLPFQVIEQVDEPRKEWGHKIMQSLFDFDDRGRQIAWWTNKLIRWDNKLILSSLKNWPLRAEIEKQWGIKLIYIDPPFDIGADFSMKIEVGEEEFTKKPTVLEEIAYRDTWWKWADSFISMIYERLKLMRDLLSDDGSIYVHIWWQVSHYIRTILDEIFWENNFRNEIFVKRRKKNNQSQFDNINKLNVAYDSIFFYSRNEDTRFKPPMKEMEVKTDNRHSFDASQNRPTLVYPIWWVMPSAWCRRWTRERAEEALKNYEADNSCSDSSKNYLRARINKKQQSIIEYYVHPRESEICDSDRIDIPAYSPTTWYDTEKSEKLLERIIDMASNEGDLVADFFCWSGTTLSASEKLWRKWIWSDLGKFGIHTTRKRMINLQRDLKKTGQNYRAFEILNLWKYERNFYLTEPDITPEDMPIEAENGEDIETRVKHTKQKIFDKKQQDFINLVIQAYKWERVSSFTTLHWKKAGRVFAIGPIDFAVGRDFIDKVLIECKGKELNKVDILGFEFEMSIGPHIIEDAKKQGIDLAIKYIPRDVFDKRAVEKGQVKFFDIAYIEVKPQIKAKSVSIELTDFSVFYTQEDLDTVIENMRNGTNKVIMDWGQIYKVIKDKVWITTKELLTWKRTDWIDYWSVDFDFESKKEIIRSKNETWDEIEEWTGNFVFENEWQSFRTKQNKSLDLKTPFWEYLWKGKKKIAVKVIDIFGNDNMKIIEVNI